MIKSAVEKFCRLFKRLFLDFELNFNGKCVNCCRPISVKCPWEILRPFKAVCDVCGQVQNIYPIHREICLSEEKEIRFGMDFLEDLPTQKLTGSPALDFFIIKKLRSEGLPIIGTHSFQGVRSGRFEYYEDQETMDFVFKWSPK